MIHDVSLERRTLQSVLGITTTSEAPASEVDPTTIGEDQVTAIDDLITETKSDRAKFLKYMGVEKVQHIRVADYRKAITALETKKREAK